MKRKIVCFLCFALASFACYANEMEPAAPAQLEDIDRQLDALNKELHALRLKSMQEEINSQPLMFEQWAKYADHIKQSELYEDDAEKVKRRIDELESQRKQILKAQQPQKSS